MMWYSGVAGDNLPGFAHRRAPSATSMDPDSAVPHRIQAPVIRSRVFSADLTVLPGLRFERNSDFESRRIGRRHVHLKSNDLRVHYSTGNRENWDTGGMRRWGEGDCSSSFNVVKPCGNLSSPELPARTSKPVLIVHWEKIDISFFDQLPRGAGTDQVCPSKNETLIILIVARQVRTLILLPGLAMTHARKSVGAGWLCGNSARALLPAMNRSSHPRRNAMNAFRHAHFSDLSTNNAPVSIDYHYPQNWELVT